MVLTKSAYESEYSVQKITSLLEKLEIEYKNINLYITAFIHRSLVNERPDFAPKHNERLEFLWDAVLELVITNSLFSDFPDKQEWELTDIRSALVRWRNLAAISKKNNFQEYLFLWKWEEASGGRNNDYLLANVMEAFIGALYKDLGLEATKKFILGHIYPSLDEILQHNLHKDCKSLIQEYSQATFDITPSYKVIMEDGPDHNKLFEVWIFFGKQLIAKGKGSSKKKAQENAASSAYNQRENISLNTK